MGRVARQFSAEPLRAARPGNERGLASGTNTARSWAISSPQLSQRLIGETDRAFAMIGCSGGDSILRSGWPRVYDGVNRPSMLWNGSRPPRSTQYVTARAYWSVR